MDKVCSIGDPEALDRFRTLLIVGYAASLELTRFRGHLIVDIGACLASLIVAEGEPGYEDRVSV